MLDHARGELEAFQVGVFYSAPALLGSNGDARSAMRSRTDIVLPPARSRASTRASARVGWRARRERVPA